MLNFEAPGATGAFCNSGIYESLRAILEKSKSSGGCAVAWLVNFDHLSLGPLVIESFDLVEQPLIIVRLRGVR